MTGPSKVGKTTFLYHLLEKELEKRDHDGDDVFQPKVVVGEAQVMHEPASCTILPNIFEYDGGDFCLVDLPGFEDTQPHARIANSYYIHKTMKCFKEISFVFVVDADSAYMNIPQPDDFINSLNTFTAMFSEKVIPELVKHVTLCVSKCIDKDDINVLSQRMSKLLLPKPTISPNSKLLLQEIIASQRILFFRRPNFRNATLPGKQMVEQCSKPERFW